MASNYPPGYSGGIDSMDNDNYQICKNGHIWTASMYSELGGGFYLDEAEGPYCPECNEEAEYDYPSTEVVKAYKASGKEIPHVGKSYDTDDELYG